MSGLVVAEHGRICMCAMAAALVILPAISAHGLVFETDSEQYDPGQPVVISGNVGVVLPGNQVAILIWNDAGELVYVHQVSVDVEGEFAAVAELPPGDGWYTIQATYNKVQSEQMGFRVGQPAVPVEPDPVEPEEVEPAIPDVAEQPEPDTVVVVAPPEPDIPDQDFWILLATAIILVLSFVWLVKSLVGRLKNRQKAEKPESKPVKRKDPRKLEDITVVFDTNICLNYMLHRISAKTKQQKKYVKNKRIKGMIRDMPDRIDRVIDKGAFCMPKTTISEFMSILNGQIGEKDKKDIGVPAESKITLYQLMEKEFEELQKKSRLIQILREIPKIPNIGGYRDSDLEMITTMRKTLESSFNFGKAKSGRVKGAENVLDLNDRKILATAMSYIDKSDLPVCLLTLDGDFLNYRGTIFGDTGVEIVRGYK